MKRVGFVLFTLVVVALLVKLGMWQLSRADEKKQRQVAFESALLHPVTTLRALSPSTTFQAMQLEGRLLTDLPILLDNQIYQGRVGYQLHYPFATEAGAVLVNLGWIAAPLSRDQWPSLPELDDVATLEGIAALPSEMLVLETDVLSPAPQGEPIRVQRIITDTLAEVLRLPLASHVLHLNADSANAQQVIWQPTVMSPEKHVGYAVQWFLMAIAVSISGLIWLGRTR